MDYSKLTIKDIEIIEGITEPILNSDSSLSLWYKQIRNKTIHNLTDGDIARLLRQEIFIAYIIDEVIKRLNNNPLIGELYEGEVLEMLSRLPADKFLKPIKEKIIRLIKNIKEKQKKKQGLTFLSSEEKNEFDEVLRSLNSKVIYS